jgi:hypothetical protein
VLIVYENYAILYPDSPYSHFRRLKITMLTITTITLRRITKG